MRGREERLRAAREKLAALKNGTVDDPKLGRDVLYLRWWALKTLLSVGTNEKGTGASLSTVDLAGLYGKEGSDVPADADLLGNACRWFGKDGSPEFCLWWANENPARFGVRRGRHREVAEGLLARYEGRLAALELAKLPPDDFDELERVDICAHVPPEVAEKLRSGELSGFSMGAVGPSALTKRERAIRDAEWLEEVGARPAGYADAVRSELSASDRTAEAPSPAPDVAYQERQDRPGLSMQNAGRGRRGEASDADGDLAQFSARKMNPDEVAAFRERAVRYDSRRVDAFVDGFAPGPVTYALVGFLTGGGNAASREQLTERLEEFEAMTDWERANVLFRLSDLVARFVTVRARGLAERARAEEADR